MLNGEDNIKMKFYYTNNSHQYAKFNPNQWTLCEIIVVEVLLSHTAVTLNPGKGQLD